MDFRVINCGSIIQFWPLTEAALNFAQTELGLEGWQWLGNAFNIDEHLAPNLVQSLQDEGFTFE